MRDLSKVKIADYESITLTDVEQLEWHFCYDWDGLLIHKDDREFEVCVCVGGDHIRKASA